MAGDEEGGENKAEEIKLMWKRGPALTDELLVCSVLEIFW